MAKILKLTALACYLLVFGTVSRNHVSSPTVIPERLGIEITTDSNDKPLYIPVSLTTEKSIVAYVPVRNGDYVTAVRIEPVMQEGRVKFNASAVSGDYEANKSCVDVNRLPARLIGSHLAKETETVNIQDDLTITPWRVKVKVLKLRPPMIIGQSSVPKSKGNAFQEPVPLEPVGPCGCATCGTENPLWCCPNRGQCMGCSNCGTVCCPKG